MPRRVVVQRSSFAASATRFVASSAEAATSTAQPPAAETARDRGASSRAALARLELTKSEEGAAISVQLAAELTRQPKLQVGDSTRLQAAQI